MIAPRRSHTLVAPLATALGIPPRLAMALTLSVFFHSLTLFGISFKPPEWNKAKGSSNLEVVLVNSKSARKPAKADALAQANLDGGGNTDAKRRAQSPLPVLEREQAHAEVSEKASLVEHKEQEAQALLTQIKSQAFVEQPAEKTTAPDGKPEAVPNSVDLRRRAMDMARLEAQIAQNMDKYQERPKRKFIGARTQEYRFARYVEDWRAKVEKIGNLNYPEEARRNKIYGSLALTVSIRANGEVESIEVSRPSGHAMLDEAAARIVRLAAPYAAFPDDIRRDTDIVSITRTWMFTKGDQLTTEN